MTTITLDHVLIASPDVVFRDLDGEAVLLHLETGLYFGLDPVGTRIWSLLGEGAPLRRLHAQLLEEYDVAPARLEADLLQLAARLVASGLVDIREPGTPPQGRPSPS